MSAIFERLRELRKAQGHKQADVAEYLGITTRHYQEIEYGKIDIPSSKLIALASLFHVSIDYLTGLSSEATLTNQLPSNDAYILEEIVSGVPLIINVEGRRIEAVRLNTGAILYVDDLPDEMRQALKPWLEGQYYKHLATNPARHSEEAATLERPAI